MDSKRKKPGSQKLLLDTVSGSLRTHSSRTVRPRISTTTRSRSPPLRKRIKSLVSAIFLGSVFVVVYLCVLLSEPCAVRKDCAINVTTTIEEVDLKSPASRKATHVVEASSVYYKNETGSKAFGHAGGVKHFIYGKLPTMSLNSLTEPRSSQAAYLSCKCGKANNIWSSTRPVRTAEYLQRNSTNIPWLVHVVVLENIVGDRSTRPMMIVICGGTLIAQQWVLTARHCFEGNLQRRARIAYSHFGKLEILEHERLLAYPGYDDTYNQHDIMLVKLKGWFPRSWMMQSVCLPNHNVIPETGRVCVVTGSTGGDVETALNVELWVEIEDPTECQSRYCGLKYDVNKNLCDKTTDSIPRDSDKEKCHGLSGNPLICNEHGRWVAYGILNWSGPDCDVTMGRGYALISTRLHWICRRINARAWPPCAFAMY